MNDETKEFILAAILIGCPTTRALLLYHIERCDRCRLVFQQVIDEMVGDAPPALRRFVADRIKERLEYSEVLEAQAEILKAEQEYCCDPNNMPN